VLRASGRLTEIVASLRRMHVQSRPYQPPSARQLRRARAGFARLYEGLAAAAAEELGAVGFEVVRLRDRRTTYTLVRERAGAPFRGWGFFALNHRPRRPYVLEVPHPRSDRYTDRQAVRLLQRLGARALLLSTCYRCATMEPSGCDGQTVACGQKRRLHPYTISDVAHATRSIFQVAHETLLERYGDALFVQLHGFDRRPSRRLHFVVSDGTRLPGSRRSRSNRLASLLEQEIGDDAAVASCNGWRRDVPLCGTQNVQARHANGSPDPCRVAATRSSNRFIHVEQSADARTRGGEIDRRALYEALRRLVPPRSEALFERPVLPAR
jgi:hypothetical protein